MSRSYNISVVFLGVTLFGAFSPSTAQTKTQKRKKPKAVFATEYPAAPDDPFYKMTVELPTVDRVELIYVTLIRKDQAPNAQPKTAEIEGSILGGWEARYQIASQNLLRDSPRK